MNNGQASTPILGRIAVPSLLIGVVAAGVCGFLGVTRPYQFFPAYLVAFQFWLGLSLGSLAMTMLHQLVGGNWGVPLRRPAEAGAMTVPLMAAFFVPITFGLQYIYPWANPSLAEHSRALIEAIGRKSHYLNASSFLIRAVVYFGIWSVLAFFMVHLSARQDTASNERPSAWMRALSGPGLVLYFLGMSLASVDWMMSLEPEWASTIYGAMIVVGQGLLTFASLIVVAAILGRSGPMAHVVTRGRLGDLGNLLLAFVMLWAYMAFSQFLIIWSGNLAEEIPWYLKRTRGGWQWVILTLIVFHFFAPFFVLLFRESKRRIAILGSLAAAIIALHLLDLIWLILPAYNAPLSSEIPWAKVAIVPLAWVGIGGIWVGSFALRLRSLPLVPLRDPAILAAIEHEGGH